jgi:hypothetical protein
LPNDRLVGVAVTATTPVPLRVTLCGLLLALSFTVRVAGSEPNADGVNVTEIVQLALAARVDGLIGQLLV